MALASGYLPYQSHSAARAWTSVSSSRLAKNKGGARCLQSALALALVSQRGMGGAFRRGRPRGLPALRAGALARPAWVFPAAAGGAGRVPCRSLREAPVRISSRVDLGLRAMGFFYTVGAIDPGKQAIR